MNRRGLAVFLGIICLSVSLGPGVQQASSDTGFGLTDMLTNHAKSVTPAAGNHSKGANQLSAQSQNSALAVQQQNSNKQGTRARWGQRSGTSKSASSNPVPTVSAAQAFSKGSKTQNGAFNTQNNEAISDQLNNLHFGLGR